LFLALGAAGWKGLGAHVERAVEVAARIERDLESRGWSVVNASPLAVLDVVPPAAQDVRALVRRVVASGRAWVAPATLEGRDVVRICVTNGEVSDADVGTLIAALTAAAG
jgi:aromatic-L-amino-acid/L-tryptophan decarboxylase